MNTIKTENKLLQKGQSNYFKHLISNMFIFATKSFLVGSVLFMLGFDLLGPHLGRKVSRGVYKIDINIFEHRYININFVELSQVVA